MRLLDGASLALILLVVAWSSVPTCPPGHWHRKPGGQGYGYAESASGRTVRLRFTLRNARLYAFQVR
jgi:hypothetical protein